MYKFFYSTIIIRFSIQSTAQKRLFYRSRINIKENCPGLLLAQLHDEAKRKISLRHLICLTRSETFCGVLMRMRNYAIVRGVRKWTPRQK
jgi:hypothetical protein